MAPLLVVALDELVQAGALPRERRPGAEFQAWSAVHSLAMLLIDEPLRSRDQAQTHDIGHRLLNMAQNGWRQPDRSAEGSHSDNCGTKMTAGLSAVWRRAVLTGR
jgi:hypothetical protein